MTTLKVFSVQWRTHVIAERKIKKFQAFRIKTQIFYTPLVKIRRTYPHLQVWKMLHSVYTFIRTKRGYFECETFAEIRSALYPINLPSLFGQHAREIIKIACRVDKGIATLPNLTFRFAVCGSLSSQLTSYGLRQIEMTAKARAKNDPAIQINQPIVRATKTNAICSAFGPSTVKRNIFTK